MERIGLPAYYHAKDPLPWMSEVIDLNKEKNFFERTVSEYRSSGELQWE
jgi:ribonucleoside-diphosphate reductase beta chain